MITPLSLSMIKVLFTWKPWWTITWLSFSHHLYKLEFLNKLLPCGPNKMQAQMGKMQAQMGKRYPNCLNNCRWGITRMATALTSWKTSSRECVWLPSRIREPKCLPPPSLQDQKKNKNEHIQFRPKKQNKRTYSIVMELLLVDAIKLHTLLHGFLLVVFSKLLGLPFAVGLGRQYHALIFVLLLLSFHQ